MYRKYLGPDWKPTYDGAGIIVSNHQAMYDTFIHLACDSRQAFIAKAEARNYPGLGGVAAAIGCIFIERAKSQEARDRIVKQVADK